MKKELKNPGLVEFSTVILSEGVGAYVEFPYDTQELFGTMGRIPVHVEFDGQPYRGTMLRYGTEKHIIIIVKKILEAIGKQAEDLVQVRVKLDDQPRIVELPDDVKQRLESDKSGWEKFNALSYTKQKEYVDGINNAKRDETRQNRIDKLLQELR